MPRLIVIFIISAFFSCKSDVIDSYQSQPINPWIYPEKVTADFDISQSDLGHPLDLELQINHHDDFPYENLYLKYWVLSNTDTIKEGIRSIHLQDDLGKWRGTLSGNTYEYNTLLMDSLKLDQSSFQVILVQYSRMDRLPGIKNVEIQLIRI